MREEYKDHIKEERYTVPVTVQLLLVKENQILMMRRVNTGYEDGKYCLPGGHVEKAEEIKDAMIREAEEEIGIEIKKEDLEVYKVLNGKTEQGAYIDFILKTEKWDGEIQNKEKEKCDEVVWIKKSDLPENIISYIPSLLNNQDEFYIPYNWD